MKHNFIKKIVGFLSAAAITLTSAAVPDVYAEESGAEEELVFNSMEEYIEYSVPRHLYAQGITTGETFEYSEPVALYDFESNSVIGSEVFIFDDNKLIAKTEIYDTEEGYVSTLDTYMANAFYSAYQTGEEIAVGYANDNLFVYNISDGYIYVDGCGEYNLPTETPQELKAITVHGEASSSLATSYSIATISLDVKHVHNDSYSYTGGLCWAASIAMKVNYQMGTNYDAVGILDLAKSFGLTTWDFDNDTITMYTRNEPAVYEKIGCAVTATENRMTHSEIYNILRENKPLAISMKYNNQQYGHEIIVKGLTLDGASSTYLVDDPNYTEQKSFVLQGNPSQTYPSFWYGYGGGYDSWWYTIY